MKKLFFVILLISSCNYLFLPQQASAQDTTKTKVKRKYNAIKGIVAFNPLANSGIASIGYERYITANSSLGLTLNLNSPFYNNDIQYLSVLIIYNHYFLLKDSITDYWLSPYLLLYRDNIGNRHFYYSNNYGIGLSAWKRFFVSNKKRLFLDVGFGLAFIRHDEYEGHVKKNTYSDFYPRLILLLGYKF